MEMKTSQQKQYLQDVQYHTASHLEARITLHERYTPKGKNIWDFLWGKYQFRPYSRILEVGCGSGAFWTHVSHDLPEHLELTFTDSSPGMLCDARNQLAHLERTITFEVADVENLPYDSGCFDLVLAHFMLYHTQSKPTAIREMKRVITEAGWVGIVLTSDQNMAQIFALAHDIEPELSLRLPDTYAFSADHACPLLQEHFSTITRWNYEYLMKVDQADLVVAYAQSSPVYQQAELPHNFWERYAMAVTHDIETIGYFGITKHCILYMCSN